jgi:hypothetical protein
MKKLKQFWAISILLMGLNSCNKGDLPLPPEPTTITPAQFAQNNFGAATNRDFIGQTVDITNNPVPNVMVKIGSATAQTDANGIFVIKNASVNEKFAYITAVKSGFINGSKAVVPTVGTNSIKIMLLPASVTATVNTGITSNVNLANGTKITFDGNFKTSTGAAYSGTVNVIVHHLDPADVNINHKMPGMLFAQAANGEAKVLETYGMVNVELKGSAGEKLQIVNPSQIEFPITATQQANAPATIPLWHFDEVNGYWIEDGIATKSGNKYAGSVKHFSWVNVDVPYNSAIVQLKVIDNSGNPIPNLPVNIGGSVRSVTNGTGQISALINIGLTTSISIFSPCGSLIHSQNVSLTATINTLPDIVITNTGGQTSMVSGTLKKCDNTNVINGYIRYSYGGNNYVAPVTNGTFSFKTLICNSSPITIIGQDFDANTNTGTFSYTLVSPATNVGNLTACNTNTESITYKIDNQPYKTVSTNLSGTVNGNSFSVGGQTPGQNDQIVITGNTIIPGIYTTSNGFQMYGGGLAAFPTQMFNITYNLINVGAIGQYIDVNFSGTYMENSMVMVGGQMMGSSIPHTISGTAHVLRDN